MGEGDGILAERVATGSGWVNGVLVECLQEPQTPLGNTNVVELRIFSPYHAPGGLERAGDGRVSKD